LDNEVSANLLMKEKIPSAGIMNDRQMSPDGPALAMLRRSDLASGRFLQH
jgi:hypothetical protein